jgi:hypothetical protein
LYGIQPEKKKKSEKKILWYDTTIMKDFIIIALLGCLLLATYIQYKETRDLRIALVGGARAEPQSPPPMASDEVFAK